MCTSPQPRRVGSTSSNAWFPELATCKLRRSAHRSVTELQNDVRAWINAWNADPNPFIWTETAQTRSSKPSPPAAAQMLALVFVSTSFPCCIGCVSKGQNCVCAQILDTGIAECSHSCPEKVSRPLGTPARTMSAALRLRPGQTGRKDDRERDNRRYRDTRP